MDDKQIHKNPILYVIAVLTMVIGGAGGLTLSDCDSATGNETNSRLRSVETKVEVLNERIKGLDKKVQTLTETIQELCVRPDTDPGMVFYKKELK